jgi:chromosome segregation ATPase
MKLNSQKIDSLLQLLTTKEGDELRELRRQRDRSRGTEVELSNAKNRVAELESKVETLIRSEAKSAQALDDSRRQVDEVQAKLGNLQREIEPLRRLDEAQKTRDQDFEQIRAQLQMQEKQEVCPFRNPRTVADLKPAGFAPSKQRYSP